MWSVSVLRVGLVALGASAILIAASNFLFGVAVTARLVDAIFQLFGAPASSVDDLATANVDNEFRFYAVFWGVYGLALIDTARRLPRAMGRAIVLIALFFVGGVGRTLSMASIGLPTTMFVVLTAIEYGLSAILAVCWLIARRAARRGA